MIPTQKQSHLSRMQKEAIPHEILRAAGASEREGQAGWEELMKVAMRDMSAGNV